MKVVSDGEAIRNILGERDRYAFYLGAGASVEAGVMTAQGICERIRAELLAAAQVDPTKEDEVERWAREVLQWDDPGRRYMTCIRRGYPNEARRVEYFRRILLGVRPSFCHHAVALLMSAGYVRPTCLTTNFDHLLEDAFTQQGIVDCQAIRSEHESRYWEDRSDRYYILKLHGDIETLNILNTREETIAIPDDVRSIVETVTRGAGLVVLGTAGNEKSVRNLFDDLGRRSERTNASLSFGLLWGVYMDQSRPERLSEEELRRLVETRVAETEVNRDIVEMIEDSPNELFCFFPVWSAGEYMFDLVKATNERLLVSRAALRLDHEMRLRHIFTNAGLSQDAVKRHLGSLRKQRFQLAEKPPPATREVDVALRASSRRVGLGLRVQYADITSRSAMADAEFGGVRRAVVSPEDTFVSAGGGVAYQLLEKAGSEALLNELAKFAPIPQGTVAVTSGGALPVHHVFHAASIEVGPTGEYLASKADVTETMVDVLRKAAALGVGVVWVPLLAAGVASLGQRASFEGLLEGLRAWLATAAEPTVPLTVAIVVYQERELPRHEVREVFGATLGDEFVLDPAAPAPEAEPTPS